MAPQAPQPHSPQPRPVPGQPPHARHIGPPTLAGVGAGVGGAGSAAGAIVGGAGRGTLSSGLVRWLRISSMAGIVISAAFHIALLSIAAVIVLAHKAGSDGGGSGAPVQFAVLNESELAELAGGQLSTDAPAVPEAPASDLPEIEIQLPETIGLESMRESLEEAGGGGTGAGDISTGGDGLGGPGTGGGSGGGGSSFFGVESTGSRFAFVVDVSGSMAIGGKMEAMTSELMRSINAMIDNNKFMVVPFSTDAAPLGGRTGWIDATEQGRSWARRAIMDLQAVGGTNPSPGFFYVFSQTPKPEAIYFLTDGEFNPVVAQEIAGLNGEHDVPIHTYCFGTRDAEPTMKRIAEQSGGQYTFIAVGGVP